ncbi:uncharacterized protein LOC107044460 [Diachasma alloeum]|uniref:uncharacterized protein LOC107044460 n=1 Tax=Diachasma alloeum TaxID=454923 RepID=UPI0007383DF1|nr:uncharacterized protein LOC107044460 [Diachasma alloeum]
MNTTCFSFNNSFFRLISGLPMGSPVAPPAAETVMQDLEQCCLQFLSEAGIHIPFFKRYVDDIITAVPKDKVDLVLEVFNSYETSLQFTHELEEENKIAFLDLLLVHEGNNIITNWYHKKTWSGRCLNFFSHHPISQKKGTVTILVDRCMKLAHPRFHQENLRLIKETLKENSYPEDFINRQIHLRMRKLNSQINNSHVDLTVPPRIDFKRTFVFPYVEGSTQNLNRIAKKYDLMIISKNEYKVNFLKSLKDPVFVDYNSNIIYSIPCGDCDGVYIGQTKRYIRTRIDEHKNGIVTSKKIKTDKNRHNKEPNHTALTKHQLDTGHNFSFSDTKICGREKAPYERNLLEMVNIIRNPHSINYRTDVNKLSSVYWNLLS